MLDEILFIKIVFCSNWGFLKLNKSEFLVLANLRFQDPLKEITADQKSEIQTNSATRAKELSFRNPKFNIS